MTEHPSDPPPEAGSSSRVVGEEQEGSRWRRWSVLLPALAFLAGLLLGGAVIGATRSSGEDTPLGTGNPSPSPSGSQQPDVAVTVPGPCVAAADRADEAYSLLERGVTAARDLDARQLADIVEQVQKRRPEVERLVRECRQRAGETITDAATSTPTAGG